MIVSASMKVKAKRAAFHRAAPQEALLYKASTRLTGHGVRSFSTCCIASSRERFRGAPGVAYIGDSTSLYKSNTGGAKVDRSRRDDSFEV
jgi:hypothetical protein